MNPKYSVVFRQIEKISDEMAELVSVYRQPYIVVNLSDGSIEWAEKWTNVEAEELYNRSIDLLLDLKKMIEQEVAKDSRRQSLSAYTAELPPLRRLNRVD